MAKKVFLVTVISFAAFFFIDDLFFKFLRQELYELLGQLGSSHIISYAIVGIPIFAGAYLLHKNRIFDSLGLDRSVMTAFLFALVCSLPAFLLFPFFYNFNPEISLNKILIIGIAAGFFEELYFRGFLYGQLYRYTRCGFILSAFLAALLYAALHLFLGADLVELVLVFLIAFISGLIFGWVYTEWNFNLWVPVFLHLFINLSWEMFEIWDDSYALMIRGFTVILFIALSVVYKIGNGRFLGITRHKLFIKKRSSAPAAGLQI